MSSQNSGCPARRRIVRSDQIGSIGDDLHSALPIGHSLSEMIDDHSKLQHRLTQESVMSDVKLIMSSDSNTARARACLLSLPMVSGCSGTFGQKRRNNSNKVG